MSSSSCDWAVSRGGWTAEGRDGYLVREDPADVLALLPRVHEHVQVRPHPQPRHVRALPAERGHQRVLAVLVGEVVVGAVDGVAGVDLRLGQPEHLFARQRLGAVRGDDHMAEYLLARRDDHAQLLVRIEIPHHLLPEPHLDADLLGVVADDLVHLAPVPGEQSVVVFGLQEEGFGEEQRAVVLVVVERVRVVEAEFEQFADDFAVGPPLEVHAAVGREVQDVAVVAARGVRLDQDRVHAPETAFDGRREAGESGTDDDDTQITEILGSHVHEENNDEQYGGVY